MRPHPPHHHVIKAPLSGSAHPLSAVPDETFAQGILGPGIALAPTETGTVSVYAPTPGLIRNIHPHAFVLQVCEYAALLVHLGVDTFRITDDIFVPLVKEGRYVTTRNAIVEWDISATLEADFETWVMVTVLGSKGAAVSVQQQTLVDEMVTLGQEIFVIKS